jgi:hypothetical protein
MPRLQPPSPGRLLQIGCLLVAGVSAPSLTAQQPIGRTSATEVQVSGAVDISHGETLLGNGSAITAGEQAVKITLQRGGSLRLCSTSTVHLSKDRSIPDPASSALMMALDRGAIEANYVVGKYSDVLLTPDLRILISGPGQADLSIRVNTKGDTCIDNHGAEAPYITVSSQLEGGAYRVLPDQRVSFQNGSLREVVDHEPELCGCPTLPVNSVASSGKTGNNPAPAGSAVGGPSSTPADTAFPLAQSEGLAAAPKPSTPVVPAGEAHAQVTVPLTYNGEAPPSAPVTPAGTGSEPAAPAGTSATAPQAAAPTPVALAAEPPSTMHAEAKPSPNPETSTLATTPAPDPAPQTPTPKTSSGGGFFHQIGHYFSKIFGR